MDNLEVVHKTFRDEVATASSSFFVWKSFNNIASADKDIYRVVNANALSWNILTHSLQSTFFITLGRIFDSDGDAFSVHTLLRSCINNIDQFGSEALRARKIRANSGTVPDWLDEYMKSTYQPKESDFLRLRGEVSKQQQIYIDIYRPIRNKVLAHKETAMIGNTGELFGRTNVGQIQDFIWFLHQIENIVFDLLYNGTLNQIGYYRFSEDDIHNDVYALLKRLKA